MKIILKLYKGQWDWGKEVCLVSVLIMSAFFKESSVFIKSNIPFHFYICKSMIGNFSSSAVYISSHLPPAAPTLVRPPINQSH